MGDLDVYLEFMGSLVVMAVSEILTFIPNIAAGGGTFLRVPIGQISKNFPIAMGWGGGGSDIAVGQNRFEIFTYTPTSPGVKIQERYILEKKCGAMVDSTVVEF